MAWRLRLVPVKTNIDFFALQWVTFGASIVAVIGSLLAVAIMGLNFGVDFKGGTTIRTESTLAVDVGVYGECRHTKGLSHYHTGCFMTHPRQGFKGRKTLRYLACMAFN